jgi:hypothetical protein
MNYYRLWVLAFLLKILGSNGDASYHFKYFFDESSFPHLVNFSGFLLGAILLYYSYKKKEPMDKYSRSITLAGYILFLVAIPLDFLNHITFGIDLTTWSPTHIFFYIATAMMVIGVWRGYTIFTGKKPASVKSLHTAWALYLIEDLIFPCQQQEIGSVNLYQFLNGHSLASSEILKLLKNPYAQFYGGIPDWLYPVYTVFVIVLLAVFIQYYFKNLKVLIAASVIYIIFRYIMFFFFHLINYPISFVPFPIVIIPIVMYLFKKWPVWGGAFAGFLYFVILYGVHQYTHFITPPVSLWMVAPVVIVGILLNAIKIPEFFYKRKFNHTT